MVAMDSDDEVMMELVKQHEADAAADRQKQMLMITRVLLRREEINAAPCRGGSKKGKAKNKERHREAGAMLLETDYFADDATNTPKEFRRRFRMNKGLFMKIVFGVREYDDYFTQKKDCTGL